MAPKVYRDFAAMGACMILTHEKLFWIRIKEICSKEILVQATIEALKQPQDTVRFLKEVKICNVNAFEETLSTLVVAIHTSLGLWRNRISKLLGRIDY